MCPKCSIVGLLAFILAVALILVDVKSCHAQNQNVPNLSGTWELIESGGATKRQLGAKFPQLTLAIEQTASGVKITQTRIIRGVAEVKEFTYYPDGRGETNLGLVELWQRTVPRFASVTQTQTQTRFESVTQWQKDKLLSTYKGHLSVGTGSSVKDGSRSTTDSFDLRKDEWGLAAKGKNLVLTISTNRMNSSSITAEQPSPGGSLDDRGQLSSRSESFKQKLVFRKTD